MPDAASQNAQSNYHEQMEVSSDLGRQFGEANQQLDRTLSELLQQFEDITTQISPAPQVRTRNQNRILEAVLRQSKRLKTDIKEREQKFSKSLTKTSQQLAEFDKALSKRLTKLEEKLSELQVSGEKD